MKTKIVRWGADFKPNGYAHLSVSMQPKIRSSPKRVSYKTLNRLFLKFISKLYKEHTVIASSEVETYYILWSI